MVELLADDTMTFVGASSADLSADKGARGR